MKNAAATAHIRELCSLGLAGELLIPSLLESMHRVIPSARNLFDWVDDDGRIQRYYFEGPIDAAVARLYFEQFHNRREGEAMPRYVDVIRGEASIRGAEELNTRQFFDSALYNEIWRPQQLHYRLEAIVRDPQRKPLGSLVLYRERGDRIFSADDEQTLATLLPYISRGLQHGREQGLEYARSEPRTALVTLDAEGRIVQLSRNAHKLLLLAHGDISPASAAQTAASENFPTLALIRRQLARRGSADPAPCTLTLGNAWGEFEFRGERLDAADTADAPALIGVAIEHRVPRDVRALQTLQTQPLSIAQKKVCALLLQGLSQPQIARRLGVSTHTVIDHVRKIYVKLDVHSAEQLRTRLGAQAAE